MWEKLFPDHYYESVFEIPYRELRQQNIQRLFSTSTIPWRRIISAVRL